MSVDDGEASFLDHHVASSLDTARDTLDVWPALPILLVTSADDIIAALNRNDRVSRIELFIVSSR